MKRAYLPKSKLLKSLVQDNVNLDDAANVEDVGLVLKYMSDDDLSNRDWATFLLAQHAIDNEFVRKKLTAALNDKDANIRGEAVWGLARRDPSFALPFILRELSADSVSRPVILAAILVADESLVNGLCSFAEQSADKEFDCLVLEAIAACENGRRPTRD